MNKYLITKALFAKYYANNAFIVNISNTVSIAAFKLEIFKQKGQPILHKNCFYVQIMQKYSLKKMKYQ